MRCGARKRRMRSGCNSFIEPSAISRHPSREKRQYLATKRSAQFISRLLEKRKPKVARIVENLAAAVEHRSLRETQSLLFRIKRQYRAAHKRYAQIHGFHSYANRSTIQFAHRQQNAL
jgi:hypothetical protein